MRTLDPDTIGFSVDSWPGRCYEVATLLVQHKVVRGKAVYGHYHGDIHPCSIFGGRTFTHHGWVERRTTIVDPTRWVFECTDPYIYVGPKDDPDYDSGGNRLRKMFMRPPPAYDNTNSFGVPKHLAPYIMTMLGNDIPRISAEQMMWLANLPLDILGEMAKPVFRWIAHDIGIPGFIPIDNRRAILGK